MSVKITRFGHRNAVNGVITIATEVLGDKLFIGVTYSSPKDRYEKHLGYTLANHRLAEAKAKNDYTFFDKELTHENVIRQTLVVIFDEAQYPRWAEDLLCEAARQPFGLKRYSKTFNYENGNNPVNISKIVVNSEEAKNQLIRALEYLHDLRNVDTDYLAVNHLVHLYTLPERIVVE